MCHFSHFWLFATPWTVAHQAPLHGILQARRLQWVAMAFSPGDFPHSEIKPTSLMSPAFTGSSLPIVSPVNSTGCENAGLIAHTVSEGKK